MANWDAGSLSPQQLGFIRDAMRARKRGNLGPVELAGLLQEGGEFMPMRDMRLGDIRRPTPGRSGTTLGQHRSGQNKRIVINPAFPSARGETVGHELGHAGYARHGIPTTHPASHGYIDAYLGRNYSRKPRHLQSGQDISRPMEAPIPRGKSKIQGGGQRYSGSTVPTTADKGIQRALDSMTRRMSQSEEGMARQKWWDENRIAIMRRMASLTGGG